MKRWVIVAGLLVGCGPDQTSFHARYDEASGQSRVDTARGVDAVLGSLPVVRYRDLPEAYLDDTEQDRKPFARRLRRKRYLRVEGTDRYKFLAGRFRIDAFLPQDATWSANCGAYEAIVLDILERQIGSKGGIGRYPGTQTVHFDVRGRRARWDTY